MNIVDLDKLCERFWDGNFMEIHKDDIPTIPSAFDGMTNGEVIQELFPNANYESCKNFMQITSANICGSTLIWEEWWNAPYKAESEDNKE